MEPNLKIFSWNCQSCANRKFIRAFREYNSEHSPDIVCLVEPKVNGKKANSVIEQLGFNSSHRVEVVSFSGGNWMGWKDSIRIQIISSHPQFIFLRINNFIFNKPLFISFVYGSLNRLKRKLLWEGLQSIAPNHSIPWLILGDFNTILSPSEKRSPFNIGERCNFFGNFVDSCALQDLGFSGPSFTWQRGGTFLRLDRALANDDWMSTFPQCLVQHLTHIKSDHLPLLLSTSPKFGVFKRRSFKFLAGWHSTFPTFVKEEWNYTCNMVDSLNNFTSFVKT